jgi:hypothetical protein
MRISGRKMRSVFEHHRSLTKRIPPTLPADSTPSEMQQLWNLLQGFRRDLGEIQPNCTKTAAEAQVNLETTVFPN